jgi:hypothetical protein
MRILVALGISFFASQVACAAQIYISPNVPAGVQPGFMERIQAATLKQAMARRGELVQVPVGPHIVRVPCDGKAKGEFATVTLTLNETQPMGIEFVSCGVASIDPPHPPASGVVKT